MKKLLLVGLLALFCSGCLPDPVTPDAKLLGKERVIDYYSYYLIHTDKGTFKIREYHTYGDLTAYSLYQGLIIGDSYNITTHGISIWRHNVIKVIYPSLKIKGEK